MPVRETWTKLPRRFAAIVATCSWWWHAPLAGQASGGDPEARTSSHFVAHGIVHIHGYGPAQGVLASADCGGSSRSDARGRFTLSGAPAGELRRSCVITFQAVGCETRTIQLVAPSGLESLGTVVLKPLAASTRRGSISYLSLAAPAEAAKLRRQGEKSLRENRPAEAQAFLEKSLAIHSADASAWFDLGMAHKAGGAASEARRAFEQAHSIDGRFVPAIVQLTLLAMREENWRGAVDIGEAGLATDPAGFPELWLYVATAHLKLGEPAAAERAVRAALDRSKVPMPAANHVLGVALAVQGRTQEAIGELRTFLRLAPRSPNAEMIREHLRRLEREAVID